MSGKFLKSIALASAAVLLLTLFTACGGSAVDKTTQAATDQAVSQKGSQDAAAAIPEKFENLVVIFPGDIPNGFDEFIKGEYGKKLKEDLNIGLDYSFSTWDQYDNKINLTISAGERLDWVWNGTSLVGNYYSKKMIQPLDELLDKYGSDLKKVCPVEGYKSNIFEGKIYGIPTNTPHADMFCNLIVRQDLLENVGMTKIETKADLDKYQELIKAKYPEMVPNAGDFSPQFMSKFEPEHITWIRFGLKFAAYVDERNNDDKVYSYYESNAFKDACKSAAEWHKKGYIPEDTLINLIQLTRLTTGKSAWMSGSIGFDFEQQQALAKNVPEGVLKNYEIKDPEKPRYISSSGGDSQMIPITAEAPERTMMWLNWIYKSQENYNFHLKDGMFYEWMFRNTSYMTFPDWYGKDSADMIKEWDKQAKYSKTYGFTFDESEVESQVAQIQTVVTQYIDPMSFGFIDYDKNIEKVIAELKKAGLDTVIAEVQKQYSAWKAQQ